MLSTPLALLHQLRDYGAELQIIDGTLRVGLPASVLTEDLRQQITGLKPQLLDLVKEAVDLLNQRCARLIRTGNQTVIGLWRDADGRDVREALDIVGLGDAEVFCLDDPESDIPSRYRQFVPDYIKTLWAKQGLLATPAERLEAEAKARYLNRFFDTVGTAKSRSQITAATVLHGMLAKKKAVQQC